MGSVGAETETLSLETLLLETLVFAGAETLLLETLLGAELRTLLIERLDTGSGRARFRLLSHGLRHRIDCGVSSSTIASHKRSIFLAFSEEPLFLCETINVLEIVYT